MQTNYQLELLENRQLLALSDSCKESITDILAGSFGCNVGVGILSAVGGFFAAGWVAGKSHPVLGVMTYATIQLVTISVDAIATGALVEHHVEETYPECADQSESVFLESATRAALGVVAGWIPGMGFVGLGIWTAIHPRCCCCNNPSQV